MQDLSKVTQSSSPSQITTGEAAKLLKKTEQTVRDWVRAEKLSGSKDDRGRFMVDEESVRAMLPARVTGPSPTNIPEGLHATLESIERRLMDLQNRDREAELLLKAVQAERDRFRAEASTFRTAAVELLAASQETGTGVRHLLGVLERQGEALSQLLTPNSPEGLSD